MSCSIVGTIAQRFSRNGIHFEVASTGGSQSPTFNSCFENVSTDVSYSKYDEDDISYHQILLIGFLFAFQHIFRANLTVTIIPMTSKKLGNSRYQTFDWDESKMGLLLSAFYLGYPILQLPAGMISERYGAKYIIGIAMTNCTLLTFVTPFVTTYGDWRGLWIVRFFQGLWQGCFPASSNVFLTKCIPKEKRNGIYSLVFSGVYLGLLVLLSSAGFLASSEGGWPSIYYLYSMLALIWIILWWCLGSNVPTIQKQKNNVETNGQTKNTTFCTPWKQILTSKPFWALVAAHFGRNWGSSTLVTQLPSYIAYIYKTKIEENGILSALPHAVTILFILTFSVICNYFNAHEVCSLTCQRKLWTSVALSGSALMLIILTRIHKENESVGMLLLILAVAFQAGAYTGILSNHTDLSPNFCGTLMGISSVIGNISSPLAPLCAGFLIQDKENANEWNKMFLLTAAIMIICNITYILFSTAEVQTWNEPESHTGCTLRPPVVDTP